jgi:ribosomal 30S subunit maturation factor RimM
MSENFLVGDIVEAFGVEGEVVSTTGLFNCMTFEIDVKFGQYGEIRSFSNEGNYEHWHKTPSLKLVKRPKQMRKIKMHQGLFKDDDLGVFKIPDCLFESEGIAKKYANECNETFIKFVAEFEIEQ